MLKIIITLDDKYGYSLFGKRLSKDRRLIQDMLSSFDRIYTTEYSAHIIGSSGKVICPIPDDIANDAVLFLEATDIPDEKADQLIVYRWNRHYPSDRKYIPEEHGWKKQSSSDFQGYSHKKITKEIYTR